MKNFKLFKEGKIDINDLKKKYLEFVIKNVFEPNMDDYLALKAVNGSPYINTYLLKNEDYGYMIKAVYEMEEGGDIEKEHFLYDGNKFSEKETYIEDEDDNYEYTSFIEDYSDIIQTITMEQYINSIKQTRDAVVKLNESHNDMIKKYLQKIEEKYKGKINNDIIDQQNILYSVEHNGRKFYITKETVKYKTHSIAFKSIYVKELDRFLWQADFFQKQKNLSTVDKTTYLSALTSEHKNVDKIFEITLNDWKKIRKEREEGFTKLNEKKMSQDIERAYIALIDEKFRETKSVFLSYQEEDEDDLGAIYAHLYDLTLLNDETYYIILIEDRVGDQGSLVELYSYLYIEEEKDFIEYNAASRIFTDNKHNDKYYKKYNDIMKEVTFDDIYEILHDDPVPKYSTAEGELSHLRTMEMREWLRIEDERNKIFKKINESVDTNKLFITQASKLASEHFEEMSNKREEDKRYVNVIYSLFRYKKDGETYYLFLEDQMYDEVTMNQNRFVYIDEENEFENRDFIVTIILRDNHPRISKEKAKCYDSVFSDFDKSKKKFELVIQKDIYEIKDAMDATTAAVVSMNEKRVKTFESFDTNEDIIKKFLGHIAEFLPQGAIMDFYQKAEEPKTLILYLIEVDLEGNKYYLSVIQYESEKDKAWKHSIYDEEKKEFVYYIEYKLNGTTGSDIVKCYETKIESSNIILELDIEQYLELTKQRESMFKKMNESKKYIKGIDTWKN